MRKYSLIISNLAVAMVLLYPIMVVGYIPFGGGIRYYSVLLPISMLLLLFFSVREGVFEWGEFLIGVCSFFKPFSPFLGALLLVSFLHNHFEFLFGVSRGVLYAALLYSFFRYISLDEKKIVFAPVMACFLYLIVALGEVYLQGRDRAWGMIYENTFGQFSVFCAGMSLLALMKNKSKKYLVLLLFSAVIGGCIAAILSGSRGALLPMIGLFFVLPFYAKQGRLAVIILCLTAVAVLYFNIFGFYDRVLLSFREVELYFSKGNFHESSVGIRLELWRIAIVSLFNSDGIGFGAVPFKDMAYLFPGVGVGATYMDSYFYRSGVVDAWLFHGDIPQIMSFGGWILLLGSFFSLVLILRFAKSNEYALWSVWCGVVWGGAEIFVFNRVSFGLILINLALFCSLRHFKSSMK